MLQECVNFFAVKNERRLAAPFEDALAGDLTA
jgi:hypothetical protein